MPKYQGLPASPGIAIGQLLPYRTPNDQVVIRPMLSLMLCADHRVVDGAVAAAFLRDLKTVLEDPQLMVL